MEFSEKDAARSKWKLTQRHRHGRGRGRAAAGRGGRGGRSGPAASRDLGTNQERYHDEEAEAAAAAAAQGPVQRSQGADLAQLLAQAEQFDRSFYHRVRVNLTQELGLPPEPAGGGFQGLTFDLKGLATCLELLPRNRVLDTDAFSGEEAAAGSGSDSGSGSGSGSDTDGELPDLDEWDGEAGQPPARGTEAAAQLRAHGAEVAAAAAHQAWAAGASSDGLQRPGDGLHVSPVTAGTAGAPQVAQPAHAAPLAAGVQASVATAAAPAAAAAASNDTGGVDDLLGELLGQPAVSSASGRAPLGTAAAASAVTAGAPTARAGPAEVQTKPTTVPRPAQQRAHGGTAAVPAVHEEHDDELDMLLGLGSSDASVGGRRAAAAPAPPSLQQQRQQPQQQQQQSLEDWLDAL